MKNTSGTKKKPTPQQSVRSGSNNNRSMNKSGIEESRKTPASSNNNKSPSPNLSRVEEKKQEITPELAKVQNEVTEAAELMR